jgi:hypothetical protein
LPLWFRDGLIPTLGCVILSDEELILADGAFMIAFPKSKANNRNTSFN